MSTKTCHKFHIVLFYKCMKDFLSLLNNPNLDILNIFKTYKLSEIKSKLDEIVSNPEGYEELKNNLVVYNNFFSLVSNIYTIEQNHIQNSVKADTVFKKEFTEKINNLVDQNEQLRNLPTR